MMEQQSSSSDHEDEDERAKPTFVRPDGSGASLWRKARCTTVTQPVSGSSGNANPRRKEANLLQKLRCREISGFPRSSPSGNTRDPEIRFFSRLPGRLAFCLRDAIPYGSIEAGHVFLGFSKCGQFLLSYTQTEVDIDLMTLMSAHLSYHYRLHWWLFVPYRRAKKVAEITLFNNTAVAGNLHLSFCQWPQDGSKVLVFGCQVNDAESTYETWSSGCSSARPCYVTVTAIPSLSVCKECSKIAQSYEDDEIAAAWNSCVRLSCLEHGMTIHTTFDLVPPYPKFEPRVSMKRDSGVVINSGNLLHHIHFELEALKRTTSSSSLSVGSADKRPTPPIPSTSQKASCSVGTWSELRISVSEFSSGHQLFSPSPSGVASDSDCESDASSCYSKHAVAAKKKRNRFPMNPERLERVAEFVNQLSPPHLRQPQSQKRLKRVLVYADDKKDRVQQKRLVAAAAEKAFELTDENFDEGVREKLSTFRKRRLADKRYEFTDDDDCENVTPLLTRSLRASPAKEEVLRPIHSNQMTELPAPEPLLSPGGMFKKGDTFVASPSSKAESSSQQPYKFHAKFTRRYVEMDDEMASVISGIECDDDVGAVGNQVGGGYHSALPLEVHGSAYQAMSMISNSMAEKLQTKCVKVQQHSLDVELFCHDMAQKLCAAAGKKYWFCNDYDVEVVDMDPDSGDVVCVAVVLVTATVVTQRVSQNLQISALQRHLHQGGLKFCWNVDSGHCQLIDSEPLKELFREPHGIWHPARNVSLALQKNWGVLGPNSGAGNIRCFTNDSVIRGTSLKTIVDTDHLVAIILDDLEN